MFINKLYKKGTLASKHTIQESMLSLEQLFKYTLQVVLKKRQLFRMVNEGILVSVGLTIGVRFKSSSHSIYLCADLECRPEFHRHC